VNSQTFTTAYDWKADIPFTAIGGSNVGMVKLAVPLTEKEVDYSKIFLSKLN
jgi:hypothetical protein